MTTAYFGNNQGNTILFEYLSNGATWLALHTAEPGPTFDTSTEVVGGGYIRQSITHGMPSGKAVLMNSNAQFSSLPSCTVRWLSVHSQQVGNHLIYVLQLASAVVVPNGQDFLVAAGDVGIGL